MQIGIDYPSDWDTIPPYGRESDVSYWSAAFFDTDGGTHATLVANVRRVQGASVRWAAHAAAESIRSSWGDRFRFGPVTDLWVGGHEGAGLSGISRGGGPSTVMLSAYVPHPGGDGVDELFLWAPMAKLQDVQTVFDRMIASMVFNLVPTPSP